MTYSKQLVKADGAAGTMAPVAGTAATQHHSLMEHSLEEGRRSVASSLPNQGDVENYGGVVNGQGASHLLQPPGMQKSSPQLQKSADKLQKLRYHYGGAAGPSRNPSGGNQR